MSERLDFRIIREVLRAGKATPPWMQSWLPSTYADADAFHDALHAFAAARREGPIRSSKANGFDFYQDCVQAHVGRKRRAVVAREGRELVTLSFESLHIRSSALLACWQREGVEAGQTVAIVLAPGIAFVVAVVTALRLGVVLSIVPPRGVTWTRTRLQALGPDHIVVDSASARIVGPTEQPLLPAVSTPSRDVSSGVHQRYAPGSVVAKLFSPLIAEGRVSFELTADVLHASLVRDALLVYALEPTDVVAAPGFLPTQHQPQLLLTTLLAGATFAEVELTDLDADPMLLSTTGVTVLGVGTELRARFTAAPPKRKPAQRAWFRSLTDVLDNERWDAMAQALAPHALLTFDVFTNAAMGGTQLFSPPTVMPGLRVWPVPGETWQLSSILGGTVPAFGPSGVYTVLRGKEADPSMPQIVLAETKDGWLFVGPIELGPSGISYPVDEVGAVVARHPGVQAAAVLIVPGRWVNDARIVLLAFVDDPSSRAVLAHAELRALIDREMGPGLLPDRIEVFPLRPRFVKGQVDRAWCRSEYLSGNLGRKARSEIFVALAQLGWIFGGDPDAR